MVMRYLYLHQRNLARSMEIVFWPVMELLVWGFVSLYIQNVAESPVSRLFVFLINAMIFWDVLFRSQQGVSLSFMEEIWSQNIVNLLVSPLRLWEWIAASFIYSFFKIAVIVGVLSVIAYALYHFNLIEVLGFYLIPFVFNLLIFGWSLGIFTSGLILRWGYAVEALCWGIPFLIQPLSAIYYPISVLPALLQWAARLLPSTHVFEGMRAVIREGWAPRHYFLTALALNIVYMFGAAVFFSWMYRKARDAGRLGRLGLD